MLQRRGTLLHLKAGHVYHVTMNSDVNRHSLTFTTEKFRERVDLVLSHHFLFRLGSCEHFYLVLHRHASFPEKDKGNSAKYTISQVFGSTGLFILPAY